jgi:hypothetical protein
VPLQHEIIGVGAKFKRGEGTTADEQHFTGWCVTSMCTTHPMRAGQPGR